MYGQLRNALAFAAFILALSTFGSAAQAAAFTVRLDNLLNPSGYGGAASAGQVRVTVTLMNGIQMERTGFCDTVRAHDFVFDPGPNYSAASIRTIGVHLAQGGPAGNDLLIIDQVELRASGQTVDSWGIDNEAGYCISWDPDDGGNSHCHDGEATPGRFFQP